MLVVRHTLLNFLHRRANAVCPRARLMGKLLDLNADAPWIFRKRQTHIVVQKAGVLSSTVISNRQAIHVIHVHLHVCDV